MRNAILLSAAVVLVACSDNSQPTAPSRASSRSNGDVSTMGIKVPDGNGKPQGAVAFSQITVVQGATETVTPGSFSAAQALCPAGSFASGGGFEIIESQPYGSSIPSVNTSRQTLVGLNPVGGWRVAVNNQQPGAGTVKFLAWAICIS